MAYHIEYNNEQIITIRRNSKKEQLYGLLLVLILVTGSIIAHCSGTIVQKILLGNKQQTHTATEQLVIDIQSGIPIWDAVETFCSELTQ